MDEETTGSGANPAPQSEGTPPAAPATPSAETPWHSSFEGETLGWLQNRGLTNKQANEALAALVDTARNAEKKLGVPADRIVTLPADLTDSAAMAAVFDKLGRPKTADDYGFRPTGEDDPVEAEFLSTLASTFHGAGLTTKQAEAVRDSLIEYFGAKYENAATAAQASTAAKLEELRREWGGTFQRNEFIANETAAKIGLSAEDIAGLRSTLGEANFLKLFARIGEARYGEAAFQDGINGTGVNTPEGALARIAELKNDAGWRKKFLAGDVDAIKEHRALSAIAASRA